MAFTARVGGGRSDPLTIVRMYQITAAIAGAGFIGPVHAEALRRLGVRIAGIVGVDRDESERARKSLGLEKSYDSFDELLNDASVQVVHLAVPNVLHYDFAKRALMAGKHVLCEKPLAMDSNESAELVELARETGLHAGVCYNLRFYPLNLEAREMISRGELGTVHAVAGSYVQDWLLYDTDYNWRVLADQGGALRAVSDIGTHWMDLITSITGLEVEAVFADLKTVHPVRKRPLGEVETFSGKPRAEQDYEDVDVTTEDWGAVLFRFKGGARGVLWVSQVTAGRKNCLRYEISGSHQALAWESERPNELWVGRRGEMNGLMLRDPSLAGALAQPFINYPGGHNEGFPDAFKQCFRSFYNAVVAGAPSDGDVLYPTFSEGHREVVICDAILQSHREETWVTV